MGHAIFRSEKIMRPLDRSVRALALLFLLSGGSAVFGGDGLMITINNDTPDGLLVTVYDRNASPPQQILSSTAIYGNASIPVSITADGSGRGHLSWIAITADRDMRRCGRGDRSGLNDGDTVNVHADGNCPGT
jgi:hypothetical protein